MFTGTGISGDLFLSLDSGPSPYTVTGIAAGSWVDIGGTTYTLSSLATYAGDDQKAYFPTSSSNGFVDFPGISVAFGSGDELNLFAFTPTTYGVLLKDQNASGNPSTVPITRSPLPMLHSAQPPLRNCRRGRCSDWGLQVSP
jgi:hypothetical protein